MCMVSSEVVVDVMVREISPCYLKFHATVESHPQTQLCLDLI